MRYKSCTNSSLIRKLDICNQRGEGYFEVIFILMIVMCLIYCFVSIIPSFIVKQNLDYMTESLVRVVEITGSCGQEYKDELKRLKAETGLDPVVMLDGNFKNNKIQIREKFSLTLSDDVSIKIIDVLFAPPIEIKVPITKTSTGMSEVYWKS